MQVLVNSDHHITGDEWLTGRVESIVHASVERFGNRITRIEVHLNDVNGSKHGAKDKRCMMEARPAGVAPVAVSDEAPSLLEAIEGAAGKLERALEHTFGRLDATTRRGPRDVETATIEELTELERKEQR